MLKKLFALSTVVVTVVAMSSAVEAGHKCCKHKRNRKCCHQQCYTCPASCNVCNTPAAAPAADAAKEAAPEPPVETK
ncbi:MAG TPA: hypothetical protein VM510_01530 [Caulifigura sp.]|nr:hypothetical protein [Caulifigura sp.]